MGRMQVRLERLRANAFRAVVGKRVVGLACAWEDCNGRFCILESYVRPDYRRRGIARSLYEAIEASSGRRLVPAVSLSDDAFEFWKRFRPAAVAEDLRHEKERLLGLPFREGERTGVVVGASGAVLVVDYGPGASKDATHKCIVVRSRREALAMVGVQVGAGEVCEVV